MVVVMLSVLVVLLSVLVVIGWFSTVVEIC